MFPCGSRELFPRGMSDPLLTSSVHLYTLRRPAFCMTTTRTAIGIDFGGTTIKSAVVRDGHIALRGEVIDTLKHDARSLNEALFAVIETLRGVHKDVAGVGVGLPGFVDSV